MSDHITAETQSWDSAERETYREYLTLKRRAEQLQPSKHEMSLIRHVAVVLSIQPETPLKPVKLVDSFYGTDGRRVLPRQHRNRATMVLKFAHSIHRDLEGISDFFDTHPVSCPKCGDTIRLRTGTLPEINNGEMDLSDRRMVGARKTCSCQYGIDGLKSIERQAIGEEHWSEVDYGQ